MKPRTKVILLVAAIAGGALFVAPRPGHGVTRLPQLLGATARLVATAVVPFNEASLLAAAQDFAAAQTTARHRNVTQPALPGGQLPVHTHRLTWWR